MEGSEESQFGGCRRRRDAVRTMARVVVGAGHGESFATRPTTLRMVVSGESRPGRIDVQEPNVSAQAPLIRLSQSIVIQEVK